QRFGFAAIGVDGDPVVTRLIGHAIAVEIVEHGLHHVIGTHDGFGLVDQRTVVGVIGNEIEIGVVGVNRIRIYDFLGVVCGRVGIFNCRDGITIGACRHAPGREQCAVFGGDVGRSGAAAVGIDNGRRGRGLVECEAA